MSILGSKGKNEVVASGEFFCPGCDGRRPYQHIAVKRYLSVLVPLVKLEDMGEYIECQECKRTWNPEVLSYDPLATAREYAAEFELAVRRVMVLIMMADGEIHKDEIKIINRIYRQITQTELSREEIWDEIAAAQTDGRGITEYLPTIVGRLNDDGRDLVLKASIFVAMADGALSKEEEDLLKEVARCLEMGPSRVREVISEMPSLRA